MALLGTYIDSRTFAALTTTQSTSFAHGLPASPDFIIIQQNATSATNGAGGLAASSDATNVSITNNAGATSSTFRVVTVVAHSIIR